MCSVSLCSLLQNWMVYCAGNSRSSLLILCLVLRVSGSLKHGSGEFHPLWYQEGSLILGASSIRELKQCQGSYQTDSKCTSHSCFPRMGASPKLTHQGQDKKEKHYHTGILGESKHKGWTLLLGSCRLFLAGLLHGDPEGHPAPTTCTVEVSFRSMLLVTMGLETQPS